MKKQKAAKRWKVLVVALCTLALAVTPMLAAWGDPSSGEMKATSQNIVDENGGQRIESFTLDNLYTYQSLGTDDGKTTLTLSTSALQNIVKNKLLPQWSPIAASVFRDQAGQLVDLYGYDDSDMMTQSGFDAYFNNMKNDKYRSETWSIWSLRDRLKQTWAEHKGDPGWDQLTVSGVKQVNSLQEARKMVSQALYDCEGSKGVSVDEFLGVDEGGGATRLGELNKEEATTGFANVVTSVNCKGASAEFDYVAFGIVFYDFEAVPVAAEGLAYVNGGFKTAENQKGNNENVISNDQQQEVAHSAKLGDSVTETTSTTISALASAEVNEKIGANMSWSETESSSETSFWGDGDDFGTSTSGSSETTTMGLDWGAAWGMAAAAGAEKGHSKSEEVSKAVETTVLLPAHTAASVSHTTTTTTYSQTYQQPVILNYKVAIYAVSGDFSSAGGINGPSYDKQSLVIKFDTREEDPIPTYGCLATDDLYSRVVMNKRVTNYDVAGGRTYDTHCDKSAWSKSEDINWDNVINTARDYYGADVVNAAKTNYFYETPGKLNVDSDKTSSKVGPLYPLYDLAKIKTPKAKYVLYSNQTLSRQALNAMGYDKDNVPFYGFDPTWGEWNRCDENGTIINNGYLKDDDPVYAEDSDTLVPKADINTGGTIYLKWMVEDENARPKTGDSPDGQNLAASNIESPVVEIEVRNAGLDAPTVTAEGGYIGSYKKSVNLNDVIAYEVTDSTDRIIAVQAKWESRVPSSGYGINVNAATGITTFTEPGTYKVRPYVINNNKKQVYSDWIEITATEHDLTHYGAQDATCDANGHIEYYECSECGKYFSDAVGEHEIPAKDIFIESTGHKWGEWTTTRHVSGDTPGEQQRVCANDASHVESRAVYAVQFNMNGKQGTAPATQEVAHGTSAKVPSEPKATGYTFEGWFTDPSCEPEYTYDFSERVTGNRVLYAKWNKAKFTVAAMAVGDTTVLDGEEQKLDLDAHGSLTIEGGNEVQDGPYTYYYREVEFDDPVTLRVVASDPTNYGFKAIQAVEVKSDASMGAEFTPGATGNANEYSFSMHAADVAVVARFGQVTVTFDGNAPDGATAYNVPKSQKIAYGGTPKATPAPSASGEDGKTAYVFTGWYTDKACNTTYVNGELEQDTTLYAGWRKAAENENLYEVTYTLYDVDGSEYTESYKVASGSTAYNPTNDLYAFADADVKYGYDLYKSGDYYWFTDKNCTQGYNFSTTVIEAPLTLYAKVVPKKFTVSFYDGESPLENGTTEVDYNTAIGTLPMNAPTKQGHDLLGWVTADGEDWDLAKTHVLGDTNLYAKWKVEQYAITYNDNKATAAGISVSGMPEAREADYGSNLVKPADPTDTTGKYRFVSWLKEENNAAGTTAWDFDTETVAGDTTLYAKWEVNKYVVTFDMQGHGDAAEITVDHGDKATAQVAPPAEGYTFGGWFTSDDGGTTLSRTPFNFNNPITKNTTLYAKWTKTPYKVSVGNLKDGAIHNLEHGAITPSSETATQGSTVTLTVAPDKNYGLTEITVQPVKANGQDGATTNGAALTPVKAVDNTYTFTMPASDVAVGGSFGQVTVTFNGNSPNGTNVENYPIGQTIAYGGAPALPDPAPTVTGYTFIGWCTDKNGSEPHDDLVPYLFTPLKENTILYAKWRSDSGTYHNVTYTLYDVPGSDPASYSVTDAVANGTTAYDPTATLTSLIPENPGYNLYEDASHHTWFTDTYCTQPYTFNTPVTKDIQLYAKIIPDSYTVKFYRDKISGVVDGFVTAKSMNYGTSIGNSAPQLTREGYTQTGWKNDNGDAEWNLSTAIVGPVTLYATWAANSYTVTFAANAPSGVTVSGMPGKQVIVYGDDNKTATQPAESPTAEGYTFGGWFTEPGCTNAYDFANTPVTDNLTLYAKWTKNVYLVTFDTNGAGAAPTAQNVEHGGNATKPANDPKLEGYTFGGWYTDAACTTAYDFSTPVTNDLTLYAKWTENTYTVTFNANGHGTAPPAQKDVKHGDKAQRPENPQVTGYTFGGWCTDAACTAAYDFNAPVKGNLTLYAKWTANKYTVTFDANGRGTAPAAQTVAYGGKATEPTAPTLEGYTFGGWCTDTACTRAYNFSAPVTGNLRLYAKWVEKRYVTIYRVYNTRTGEHLYTSAANEVRTLISGVWNYEGVAWYSPEKSNTPVYRLYDRNSGEHFYTSSKIERDIILSWGHWNDEGIAWYSDDAKGTPVYRLHNEAQAPFPHHFTTSIAECDVCTSQWGWSWEGERIAWYGLAMSSSSNKNSNAQDLIAITI